MIDKLASLRRPLLTTEDGALQARAEACVTFGEQASVGDALDLVRLLVGLPPHDSEFVQALRDAVKQADGTVREARNDHEIAMLAAVALDAILTRPDAPGDVARAAVNLLSPRVVSKYNLPLGTEWSRNAPPLVEKEAGTGAAKLISWLHLGERADGTPYSTLPPARAAICAALDVHHVSPPLGSLTYASVFELALSSHAKAIVSIQDLRASVEPNELEFVKGLLDKSPNADLAQLAIDLARSHQPRTSFALPAPQVGSALANELFVLTREEPS
jgi:hypothetical protein